MLFDPILNSSMFTEEHHYQRDSQSEVMICAHCYRPIKGKYFQSGKNYYDEYCWQFRFVIDPLYLERAARRTIMHFDDDGEQI